MKQITFIVSGNVQKSGYRDRVIELGKFFSLTGLAENLPDGTVRIIAVGEEKQLESYKEHINIKNTLINVENIEFAVSEATTKFNDFKKLVSEGETDSRLDIAAVFLKELIEVTKSGFKSLKEDTSAMLEKQDKMIEMQASQLEKQDEMLEKQNQMLEKQDTTIQILKNISANTSDIKSTIKKVEIDVRDSKLSLLSLIEQKLKEHEIELTKIKATLIKVQETISASAI